MSKWLTNTGSEDSLVSLVGTCTCIRPKWGRRFFNQSCHMFFHVYVVLSAWLFYTSLGDCSKSMV